GSLIQGENELAGYFADVATIARHREKIYQELVRLAHAGTIQNVVAKLDRLPPVYVAFQSKISGSSKRLNINAAHHIDLIDMFQSNNSHIKQLAQRLDRGEGFTSEEEFVNFAAAFDQQDLAQAMIEQAKQEIAELGATQDSFRFKD